MPSSFSSRSCRYRGLLSASCMATGLLYLYLLVLPKIRTVARQFASDCLVIGRAAARWIDMLAAERANPVTCSAIFVFYAKNISTRACACRCGLCRLICHLPAAGHCCFHLLEGGESNNCMHIRRCVAASACNGHDIDNNTFQEPGEACICKFASCTCMIWRLLPSATDHIPMACRFARLPMAVRNLTRHFHNVTTSTQTYVYRC